MINPKQAWAQGEAHFIRCIIASHMREERSTRALFDKLIRQTGGQRVRQIRIGLGEISELDPASIQQHWSTMSAGTVLQDAELQIRIIQAEAQCMACFKKYHPVDGRIHCPHCGSFGAKILSGEEFHIEHIDA